MDKEPQTAALTHVATPRMTTTRTSRIHNSLNIKQTKAKTPERVKINHLIGNLSRNVLNIKTSVLGNTYINTKPLNKIKSAKVLAPPMKKYFNTEKSLSNDSEEEADVASENIADSVSENKQTSQAFKSEIPNIDNFTTHPD